MVKGEGACRQTFINLLTLPRARHQLIPEAFWGKHNRVRITQQARAIVPLLKGLGR